MKGTNHSEDLGLDGRIIGWEGVDWIHLVQHRDQWRALVDMVMKLRVPQKVGNFWTRWTTTSFWKKTLLHEVSYDFPVLSPCTEVTRFSHRWCPQGRFPLPSKEQDCHVIPRSLHNISDLKNWLFRAVVLIL